MHTVTGSTWRPSYSNRCHALEAVEQFRFVLGRISLGFQTPVTLNSLNREQPLFYNITSDYKARSTIYCMVLEG